MQRPSRARLRGRPRPDRIALLHQFGGAETAAEIDVRRVPSLEPKGGMCFSPKGPTDFHPPAARWGERHVAWNDTRYTGDHLPAGRLQRPFRRLRLWH